MSDLRSNLADHDAALYGKDPAEGLVALHVVRDPSGREAVPAQMRLYWRRGFDQPGGGTIETEDVLFYPFLLIHDAELLRGFGRDRFRYQRLDESVKVGQDRGGQAYFRDLVVFTSVRDYWDAVRHVERVTETEARRPEEIYFAGSPEQVYLMQTGRTLFKGMAFEHVHRLQLDIEVYAPDGFPQPERAEHAVIIVALSDNRGWSRLLHARDTSEKSLLEETIRVIQERDPDVIEGHNCFLPGTSILTPTGPIPIEEAQPGDRLLSGSDLALDTVHQVHRTAYQGEIVVISAQYRSEVKSTPDHPHYGYTQKRGLGWSAASDFESGDFLAVSAPQPGALSFDADAYLAGLIYADGHLATASNRVSFGNTDPTLVSYVCAQIGGHYRVEQRENAPGHEPLLRVFTHDLAFRSLLQAHGVPPGNKSRRDSKVDLSPVFEKGLDGMASFLAGVIDGDGHVTEKGVIHIASRPTGAKEALLSMCLQLGLLASCVRNGLYVYPSSLTRDTFNFFRQYLKSATKRGRLHDEQQRSYDVSGTYDHLPPTVIDLIRPFVRALSIPYSAFPLAGTTVNYLLNKRTSARRHSLDALVSTIEEHLTPEHRADWDVAWKQLDDIESYHWFRIKHTSRRAYEGPVYNLGTGTHTYVASGVTTHNCYSFDFDYLLKRCQLHGVPFAIGRDGSVPRQFPSSMRFAERMVDFPALDIAGRHVIDTLFQVMSFDVFKRDLPGYGLKVAAKYFGFADEMRTYVEGSDIARVWDEDPARLLDYALDDVVETERLARHLSGSTFYLTQMVPMPYGQTARTGPASKIEALFVREYLRQRQALPRAAWGSQTIGGYTDVFVTGVVGPVVYADVESLYPSIMLQYDVRPKDDALGVFPDLLRKLTELRFETKAAMKATEDADARAELDARQTAYKNIINSFYGNLAFSLALFNDFAEADRVAATGQDLLRQIIRLVRADGGTIIEVDTDGVLFIPPDGIRGDTEERAYVRTLSERMPEGIRIGFDGRFQKMLSYKKKNYALLGYDGRIKFKGSSLVSRSTERFGRRFVREAVRLLLEEDIQGLHDLYLTQRDRILAHDWTDGVADFQRTETLKNTLQEYETAVEAGQRTRAASYELAKQRAAQTGQPPRKGDRMSYYLAGPGPAFDAARLADTWDSAAPDEHTPYYLDRLDQVAAKFISFFETEHQFRLVFSPEDLFGFDASGIRLARTERAVEDVQDDVPF